MGHGWDRHCICGRDGREGGRAVGGQGRWPGGQREGLVNFYSTSPYCDWDKHKLFWLNRLDY